MGYLSELDPKESDDMSVLADAWATGVWPEGAQENPGDLWDVSQETTKDWDIIVEDGFVTEYGLNRYDIRELLANVLKDRS